MLIPPGMSTLEVAAGVPIGVEPEVPPPDVSPAPMAVLEEVVADVVRRTPCSVAFSGGQDSSLVLAAAIRAAERYGLPKPVAVTVRFGAASKSDESTWQDLVLEHLGVERKLVTEVGGDLDLVGPIAAAELVRRGVVFPANSHSLAPLVAAARGGSLLVGLGGDELFGNHRWMRLNDALARRRRPRPRDAARLAVASLPRTLRTRVMPRRRSDSAPPWLRSDAARTVERALRRAAYEPVRFDAAVRLAARARTPVVARATLRRLGEASGVDIRAPLLDPRFVEALARAGGARGWGDRVAVMHAVAGNALPIAVLDRRDKARFGPVFFGAASRRFAETWDGAGVDTALVDPEALRSAWLEPEPDFRSALLLQVAWRAARDPATSGSTEPRLPGGKQPTKLGDRAGSEPRG